MSVVTLKAGINLLVNRLQDDPKLYQEIIKNEAMYKDSEQISAEQLQETLLFIREKLNKGDWDEQLESGKSLRVNKGKEGSSPIRTLSFITMPNGEIGIIIETKSKLVEKKIKDKYPEYKKPGGAIKHGTPCLLLWPRDPDKPNKRWWAAVVAKEEAFGPAVEEAQISMQNHPYIQASIVGAQYRSEKHQDNRLPLYGEIAEGGDLEVFLKENRELKDIQNILYSFLLGMEHFHSRHLLHRDVKPANILVAKNTQGQFYGKVMDFGETNKNRSEIAGDPHFFSPEAATAFYKRRIEKGNMKGGNLQEELARYQRLCGTGLADFLYHDRITQSQTPGRPYKASEKDDVWSIGATLLEICVQQKLLDKNEIKELIKNQAQYRELEDKVKSNEASDLDKIKYVIVNCLQFEPQNRFTVSQVIAKLPNQEIFNQLRKQIKSHPDLEKRKSKSIVFTNVKQAASAALGKVSVDKTLMDREIVSQIDKKKKKIR